MAQYARPSTDTTVNSWTTEPLWSKIDEVSYDDGDSIAGPTRKTTTATLGLSSVTDPVSEVNHILRIRAYETAGIVLTVGLYSGTTLIKTWDPGVGNSTFTSYTVALTTVEANNIANYGTLSMALIQTYSSGSGTRKAYVSWAEFEVPNAVLDGSDYQTSFILGGLFTTAAQDAFTFGGVSITSSAYGYASGQTTFSDAQSAFSAGGIISTDNNIAYAIGSIDTLASQDVFINGSTVTSSTAAAYSEGFSAGGPTSDNNIAFLLGIENPLFPDGLIGKSGIWLTEISSEDNTWLSIDESAPDNLDYVYNIGPTTNEYIEWSITNPSGTPGDGDIVVFWSGKDNTASGVSQATIQLRQGATIIASSQQTLTATPRIYYFTLTPTEKSNITDWNDLRVRIIITVL